MSPAAKNPPNLRPLLLDKLLECSKYVNVIYIHNGTEPMEKQMANAADYNRWGPTEPRYQPMLRPSWHPGWILLTVAGFIVWWPIGLALLFYTLWSRNMGCWDRDRFANKMERMQWKMERMRNRMDRGGFGFGPPSSGNRAFDEYRMETLRRLEEEQVQFKEFLDRLRHAKDKEEFDAFMAQHRTKPNPSPDNSAQG